jgi:hypothetical protein
LNRLLKKFVSAPTRRRASRGVTDSHAEAYAAPKGKGFLFAVSNHDIGATLEYLYFTGEEKLTKQTISCENCASPKTMQSKILSLVLLSLASASGAATSPFVVK